MLRAILGTSVMALALVILGGSMVGCSKPKDTPKTTTATTTTTADKKAIELKAKEAEVTVKQGKDKEVELTFTRGDEATKEAKITIEPADKDGVTATLTAAKIDEKKTDAPKVKFAAKADAKEGTVEFTVTATVDGATAASKTTIKVKVEK